MNIFTGMLVFAAGSLAGWIIELNYRTFVSQKKLVNPGFLSGPYLPIYGFGTFFLFLLSLPEMSLWLRVIFFLAATTILEWLTGEFFLKFFNLRLWDYTKKKFNYKGLVCPEFSIYWTILAMLFYFFAFPPLKELTLTASTVYYAYLAVGFYYGIFIEDVVVSFHLASKLSRAIKEEVERQSRLLKLKVRELSLDQRIVDLRLLKLQLRNNNSTGKKNFSSVIRFFNPFSSLSVLTGEKEKVDVMENIKTYVDKHWRGSKQKGQET